MDKLLATLTVLCYIGQSLVTGTFRLRMVGIGKGTHRCVIEGFIEIENPPVKNWLWISPCPSLSDNDAVVMCRTLGYNSLDANYVLRYYNELGTALSGDFKCNGTETTVNDCGGLQTTPAFCTDSQLIKYVTELHCSDATEGKLRLRGGYDDVSGQLEIYHDNAWGAVCNDSFGEEEIAVACSQITNGAVTSGRHISNSSRPDSKIWLDGVSCASGHTTLAGCTHGPWGGQGCANQNTVFIACDEVPRYRLANQAGRSGELQVYHSGEWGRICNYNTFDQTQAWTACNTLNLTTGAPATSHGNSDVRSYSVRAWLERFTCKANALSINDCQKAPWGVIDYSECFSTILACEEFDKASTSFYLGRSISDKTGLIYVHTPGQVRSGVCMENPSRNIAVVACRSVGRSTANAALVSADLFASSIYRENYLFKAASCNGNETRLTDCSFTSAETMECDSAKRLAVSCGEANEADYSVRLVKDGIPNSNNGRLEIAIKGTWGTVCRTHFSPISAKVVCRELGHKAGDGEVSTSTPSVSSPLMVWLAKEKVECSGQESKLADCPRTAFSDSCTGHSNDVAVLCASSAGNKATGISLIGKILFGVVLAMILSADVSCGNLIGQKSLKVTCSGSKM